MPKPKPKLGPTEIVTAEPVRLSFPALFEPKPVAKSKPDEKKYMATMLLPPDFDMKPFHLAMRAAMESKFGKVIKLPAKNNPIKDCEEKEDLAGYQPGWHFVNVKSNFKPDVVDRGAQPIMDQDRIFAGCWVRMHINCYAWSNELGGKGVSFGLNAVQLIREDERLDGRKSAADVFDPVEPDDDIFFDAGDDADDSGFGSDESDASDLFGE